MAEYVLTPERMRLLLDGFARVEAHPDGVTIVIGDDRLVLPASVVDPMAVVPVFVAVSRAMTDVVGEALVALDRQHAEAAQAP